VVEIGDVFTRDCRVTPSKSDRVNWVLFTGGSVQTRSGMVVFVDNLPEAWAYVRITGLSRNGRAAFGKAEKVCKCQRSDGLGSDDLRACVCDAVDQPNAYVVVCNNWDKVWSWAGYADSSEQAERSASLKAPWEPESYSTMRANKFGCSASLWRNYHGIG